MSSNTEGNTNTSNDSVNNETIYIVLVTIIAVIFVVLAIVIILRSRWHWQQRKHHQQIMQEESQPYSLTTLSQYFKLDTGGDGTSRLKSMSDSCSGEEPAVDSLTQNRMYGSSLCSTATFPGRPSVTSIGSTNSARPGSHSGYGILNSSTPTRPGAQIEEGKREAEGYMEMTSPEHQATGASNDEDILQEKYEDMRPSSSDSEQPKGSQAQADVVIVPMTKSNPEHRSASIQLSEIPSLSVPSPSKPNPDSVDPTSSYVNIQENHGPQQRADEEQPNYTNIDDVRLPGDARGDEEQPNYTNIDDVRLPGDARADEEQPNYTNIDNVRLPGNARGAAPTRSGGKSEKQSQQDNDPSACYMNITKTMTSPTEPRYIPFPVNLNPASRPSSLVALSRQSSAQDGADARYVQLPSEPRNTNHTTLGELNSAQQSNDGQLPDTSNPSPVPQNTGLTVDSRNSAQQTADNTERRYTQLPTAASTDSEIPQSNQ